MFRGRNHAIGMLEQNIKQPTITIIFLLASALEIKPSKFVKQIEEALHYDNYFE
ncbi:hypothetical protein GAG94_08480 [Lysinibacillus sphaericus]|nr:hypothetical protein GAG94_08480 [Lysinibacillus sphaericus]